MVMPPERFKWRWVMGLGFLLLCFFGTDFTDYTVFGLQSMGVRVRLQLRSLDYRARCLKNVILCKRDVAIPV